MSRLSAYRSRWMMLLMTAALSACGGGSTYHTIASSSGSLAPDNAVVTTTGTFTPVMALSVSGVNVYRGIRYAAPPVGALRWAPPAAPTPPTGTVVASGGNVCPQGDPGETTGNEDCLFLNVWVPGNINPSGKLPVFFWIHGGSLTGGGGESYDPGSLVHASNIIVVTINYRLGALGWLVEPGLAASTASTFENVGDAGNYGLMDQQFALQWVQTNIAKFGGDPTKVTIGGESAGGLSVTSNLTSTTTATGLFRAAIIESGAYMIHYVPTQAGYQSSYGQAFDSKLGCTPPNDADCLRNAKVSDILTAQGQVFGAAGISPDTGTRILPSSLSSALSAGNFIHVPVLQGTNANEGRLFEPAYIPSTGASSADVAAAGGPANYDLSNANSFCASGGTNQVCTYPQEVTAFLGAFGLGAGGFSSQIATDYPLAGFPDPYLSNNAPSSDEALSQIFTDVVFACNGLDSNNFLSQFVTVYAYEFNDPLAPPVVGSTLQSPNDIDGFPTASEHAAELPFIFNNTGNDALLSANETTLAGSMRTYWGNFVVSGNPNTGASAPNWPAFTSTTQTLQNLVPGPQSPAAFTGFSSNHFCSTWEPILSAE